MQWENIKLMHKVFISYHHANDQWAKDALIEANNRYGLFIDYSVDTGDIDDSLSSQSIRRIIRDEYLRESSVTILLVGTETYKRKHVDWEIYSSMYDGAVNRKSGLVVVQLPSINPQNVTAAYGQEEQNFYPGMSWSQSLVSRNEYELRYPFLPDRIIDNLGKNDCKISITTWDAISKNLNIFVKLINWAYESRLNNQYDLSRPMMENNKWR